MNRFGTEEQLISMYEQILNRIDVLERTMFVWMIVFFFITWAMLTAMEAFRQSENRFTRCIAPLGVFLYAVLATMLFMLYYHSLFPPL